MNKKGIELSLNVIIITAIGLLVLIILAVLVLNYAPQQNGDNQITGVVHMTPEVSEEENWTWTFYNDTYNESTSEECCYPIECYKNITEYINANCSRTCEYAIACYEEEMNWTISNESIWMVAAINRTTDINYIFNKNGTEIIDIKSNENYTNYTIIIDKNYFKEIPCDKNHTCYGER